MEVKLYNNEPEETMDELDQLIAHEINSQAQWQAMMQDWEQRKRRQRRLRLLPVISNIVSVAALMVLGFFIQSLMPEAKLADQNKADQLIPVIEKLVTPTDSTVIESVSPTRP